MDAEHAKIIAPAVQELEDLWGRPPTEMECECVLAGYVLGLHNTNEAVRRLRNGVAESNDLGIPR